MQVTNHHVLSVTSTQRTALRFSHNLADIQVLIIHAAYQTGLNIDPSKTRLDYIVVHNSNEDTQTQAKGRYRGDIDVVYTREKSSECEYVIAQEAIAPYLGIRLYTKDKKELC